MTHINDILLRLAAQGVDIFLKDGKLKAVARKGGLDDAAVTLIKHNKDALMEFLGSSAFSVNTNRVRITSADRTGPLPLSFAQQRLWFLDQLERGSAHYNLPAALGVSGKFDATWAEQAFTRIIERHEPLRTVFASSGGQPCQVIQETFAFALGRIDLRALAPDSQARAVQEAAIADGAASFDLARDLMLRASYLLLSDGEGVLLFNMHHIASDGWSIGVLIKEFIQQYDALRRGGPNPLRPLAIQYADYAQWQRNYLVGDVLEQQLRYWDVQLADLPAVHRVPLDHPRPEHQGFRGAGVRFQTDLATQAGLKRLAQDEQVTLFMVLHAAITIVLARHSNCDDIVIGTPVANRLQKELEDIIGFFVNTLVLRTDSSGNPGFTDYLRRIKAVNLDAQSNQDIPFEYLVERLKPSRSTQYGALFQIMFSMNTNQTTKDVDGSISLDDVRFNVMTSDEVAAKVELTFNAAETPDGLAFSIDYNTDLFDAATIERMAGHLSTVLNAVVANPHSAIHDLPLLSASEQHDLLHTLNSTDALSAPACCIYHLFENQVARTPDNIALMCEGQALTYAQLNAQANQLARHLRDQGVRRDTLVGLYMERSPALIVGLLAILKAGGAYVPLDPSYPLARLAYVVEDSAIALLLTQDLLIEDAAQLLASAMSIDGEKIKHAIASNSTENLPRDQSADSLVYVIYTSGSTGQPKGVMVEHKALVNANASEIRDFGIGSEDRVLHIVSFSFDPSVGILFSALNTGACLYLTSAQQDLPAFIEQCGITHATFPAAVLAPQSLTRTLPTLKVVATGGGVCPASVSERWAKNRRYFNLYGPTETTITAVRTDGEHVAGETVIGTACDGVTCYVLSPTRALCPFGTEGELYIGGAGLARGYLNRPELTAERFIVNPFDTANSARLYRTGDLVRYLPDGQLGFMGRIDDQVKIRGFRIEPGEIAHQLSQHPAVASALVVARADGPGEPCLVAYFTVHDALADRALLIASVQQHLSALLPEHMVPALYVVLDAFPLTPNGKIDKKALPAPDASVQLNDYIAPQTQTETILVGIWSALLHLAPEKISVSANFFALGGHSLLVIELMARLQQAGYHSDVRTLFGAPSLQSLAATLALGSSLGAPFEAPPNLIPNNCGHITPDMLPLLALDQEEIDRIVATVPGGTCNVQDIYPLAPLQEGILFHHLMNQASDPYIMPVLLSVASWSQLDAFLAALQQVINRHDVLRTAIVSEHVTTAVQVVYEHIDLPVSTFQLDPHVAVESQLEALLSAPHRMTLSEAPLLRASIAQDPHATSFHVLLQLHHIVSDHVGLEIIQGEIAALLSGDTAPLAAPIPYRQFVAHALHQSRENDAQTFFTNTLGDVSEPTTPFNLRDVHGDGSAIGEAKETLGAALASRIRSVARQHNVSPATLFHAAWALVVAHCSGRDDVVFGTVLSGRLQGTTGAAHMLGMFINTLPLRLKLEGMTVRKMVGHTETALRDLLAHEQASLALAQRCSALPPGQPLFSAMLNFRHSGRATSLPGSDGTGVEFIRAQERSNYPFNVSIDDLGDGFSIDAQVSRVIDPQRVLGFVEEAISGIVDALEGEGEQQVLSLEILPTSERDYLLHTLSATRMAYPNECCIHGLFEAQAARTPDKVAVVFGDSALTYAQLNARANQLAHYLREHGHQTGGMVGLCMERSLDMVAGMLAILKAGAAYVPLDPAYPEQRLDYMVQDCALSLIFTDATLETLESTLRACPTVNLPGAGAPGDVAYVNYTSGSTGQPKGVLIEHRSVVRLVIKPDYVELDADSVILQMSSLSFDAATFEIWGALLNGGSLILYPHKVLDLGLLNAEIDRHQINTMWLTAALFEQWSYQAAAARSLKWVLAGGDVVNPHAVRRVYTASSDVVVINGYGPTENTTFTCCYRIPRSLDEAVPLPIGKAITATTIYVLSPQGRLAPIGAVGELCIGGDGLARGYLNRLELTAERFIANPFDGENGTAGSKRLYRSGDLVRFRADGNLDYLGRVDDQVKVRGFRIEPGEIIQRLQQYSGIASALVVAREDAQGNKQLVAYVISSAPSDNFIAEVSDYLQSVLPEYMMPAHIVLVDEFPLTPNGKIDKRALPAPDASLLQAEYVSASTSTETALVAIWAELLQLKAEQISITGNFFALGGHSLLAIRLVAQVRKHLDTELSIRDVFQAGTLSALAALIDASSATAARPQVSAVARVGNTLPLSFAQQRLWFLDQLEPGGTHYNMPAALRVQGRFDESIAQQAFRRIIARHEPLRTVFVSDADNASQLIRDEFAFVLPSIDLRELTVQEQANVVRDAAATDGATSFDLTRDLMLRAGFLRLGDDQGVLLFNMHHIASDGWSMSLLVDEFMQQYSALSQGLDDPLPPLAIQYADYAQWQRNWLVGDVLEQQLGYWDRQLANLPPVHSFPLDHSRPAQQGFKGASYRFKTDQATQLGLNRLARKQNATMFMVLHGALSIVLSKHAHSDDLVIGTPVANRLQKELEQIIGFFVNTLVLRSDSSGNPSFIEYLERIKTINLDAQSNQDVPFEYLVERLKPARSTQYSPLFQIMFSMDTNHASNAAHSLSDVQFTLVATDEAPAKFELTFTAAESDDGLEFSIDYNSDLFEPATMQRLASHVGTLLKGIVANPSAAIRTLPLLSDAEQQHLLHTVNATQAPYPQGCIHTLFEAQAARTPDNIAVVFEHERLSYAELNAQANRLAHYLIEKGIEEESLVGLCLERGAAMIVGVLAILKAGGAYLPLDPAYPDQRLAYMIDNSAVKLVLTQASLQEKMPQSLCLDSEATRNHLRDYPGSNPSRPQNPHSLAYVIYTSGSTGQPKGVMVEHGGVGNLAKYQQDLFAVAEQSRVLAFASLSFDAAMSELVMALLKGASLHVCTEQQRQEPVALESYLIAHAITHATFPPALLLHLNCDKDYALESVILAGEACTAQLAAPWLEKYRVFNAYGPTETTVCATAIELQKNAPVSIGRAVSNFQLYVLDEQMSLLPQGAIGELYIGGVGLARGYLNRPDLTAERFVTHPSIMGARLYKSGDLVRYRPDGNLYYLGRSDEQVKIRGFRIELGEIEQQLAGHPAVASALVLAREERLVAYVTASIAQADLAATLKDHLLATLPAYMVPALYVVMDAFPLTANGKIDKKALPLPDASAIQTGFAPAQTATEKTLVNIWATLLHLNVDQISVTSDFFALGGHSLLAIQLVGEVRKELTVELSIKDIFLTSTVTTLAHKIDMPAKNALRPQVTVLPRETNALPLSFAQQRLWFLDQLGQGSAHYNMPSALRIQGKFDHLLAEEAFRRIIARHEPLRTVFVSTTDSALQVIREACDFQLTHLDLRDLCPRQQQEAVSNAAQTDAAGSFDLARDLMLRASFVRLGEDDGVLLFNMHHIASDGWSMGLLVNEFVAHYDALSRGIDNPLRPLAIQYADYAQWQRNWLVGDVLEQQLAYWDRQLADLPPVHGLPLDRPRPARQAFRGATRSVDIDNATYIALRRLAQTQQATMFMVLHAALSILLARHGNSRDIVIGTPVANRLQKELEEIIGFFVNTLVLRSDVSGNSTFIDFLQQIKTVNLDAQSHQDVPFEYLVERLKPARSAQYSALFQILFSMDTNRAGEVTALALDEVQFSYVTSEQVTAKFELTFTATDSGNGLSFAINYNTDLFDAATIGRLGEHLGVLLNAISAHPDTAIHALPLQNKAEKDYLLQGMNATQAPYPHAHCIHQLFEAQAAATPDNIAVVFDGERLTYAQLNEQANQLARHLHQLGVQPGNRVAICVDRSVEMVVGLIGVLKAGAAYVPIDPNYPSERLAHVLTDNAPAALLIQAPLRSRISAFDKPVVMLDQCCWSDQPAHNLGAQAAPDDPAYVIYTSGSTGLSKGVVVAHRSAVNFWNVLNKTTHARCKPNANIGLNASFFFDMSLKGLLQLLSGHTLHIIAQEIRADGSQFLAFIGRHAIDAFDCTPSQLELLLTAGLLEGSCHQPASVLIGGEAIGQPMWDKLRQSRTIEFHNMYGPTECTVDVTIGIINGEGPTPHIGRQIANMHIYILDPFLQIVPYGVAGEIHVAGVGVALEYFNRPELTLEKFIANPFAAGTMYKTGDVGRYLPDGNIEYLGRNDSQVKVRGFRIELGEIENRLAEHPEVGSAVVLAREDAPGAKRLVAYLTRKTAAASDQALIAALKSHLHAALPDYMVPAQYMVLEAFPLTPNGKINKTALPVPDASVLQDDYVAPRTPTERKIAEIWGESLHLDADQISITSNFFALGGHSLLVIQLLSRLQEAGLRTDVRTLFGAPTLESLAATLSANTEPSHVPFSAPANLITDAGGPITPDMLPLVTLSQEEIDAIVDTVPGGASNVQDIYPLAPLQEGILFNHLVNQQSDPYIMPVLFSVRTREQVDAFVAALQATMDRHDVLRTAIVSEAVSRTVQVVLKRVELPVTWFELDPSQEAEAQLRNRLSGPQKMDLSQAPLLRASVAQDPLSQRCFVLLQLHHIISDHIGLEIIQAEVSAFLTGETGHLTQPVPYREFVAHALHQARHHDAEAFFTNMLGDVSEPTAPFNLLDVHGDGSSITVARKELTPELALRIRQSARRNKVSPATLFHAAWALVLAHCSGRDDVVFGTVLSGRLQGTTGAAHMLGMFINTLPLRLKLDGMSARQIVAQTESNLRELLAYEQASLALAQRCSAVPGGTPLFSAMLNYRHTESSAERPAGDVDTFDTGISIVTMQERSNYPFNVSINDLGEAFSIDAQVDPTVSPLRVIGYVEQAITSILTALDRNLDTPVLKLAVLPQEERDYLVHGINAGRPPYPRETSVHGLFEAQAASTPDNIALFFDGEQLTYAELNRQANQLAHYLRQHITGRSGLVGLCIERGINMVIGMLAIYKAGLACVPLDPGYPQARLAYMVEDSALELVLTQESLKAQVAQWSVTPISLDCATVIGAVRACPDGNLRSVESLAYVIYTSGSTGQPKGVMVDHGRLSAHIQTCARQFELTPDCNVLQFATINFDAAQEQIFCALTVGARISIRPGRLWDAREFYQYCGEQSVTVANLPPGYCLEVLRDKAASHAFFATSPMRLMIVGGEAVSAELKSLWRDLPSDCGLINAYGPTEIVITCSMYRFQKDDQGTSTPIGSVLAGRQLYVVGEHGLAPFGVSGELHIAGVCQGRGYLNRPELTAERFIANPFYDPADAESSPRLYKSGDLVRYLADGNLDYLGRIDDQVKIRGFRIELGEIEYQLTQHGAVESAVVLVREDAPGEKRLVAYVTAHARTQDDPSVLTTSLREHLTAALPDHMVPSHYVMLDALPMTPSGKIDRKALPAPDTAVSMTQYVGASTDTEKKLANIWSQVLGIEKIGINDHFFEAGGHSLLVISFVSKAKQLGMRLVVRDLLLYPVLRDLACVLDKRSTIEGAVKSTSALDADDHGPIHSLPNKHMFVKRKNEHHWNISQLFEVDNINIAHLQQALGLVIAENDGLRHCLFRDVHGIREEITPYDGENVLDIVDLSATPTALQSADLERLATGFQKTLSLTEKLYKFVYFDLGRNQPGRFLYIFHHVIFDGYSATIFLRDLHEKLLALGQGIAPPAAIPTTSAKAWGRFLHRHINSEAGNAELAYWTGRPWHQCKDLMDFPQGYADNRSGDPSVFGAEVVVTRQLDADLSNYLLRMGKCSHQVSTSDAIFSALSAAIARATGSNTVSFDLMFNGRAPVFAEVDLSGTMGWLVDNVPVLIEYEADQNMDARIASFQRQFQAIPNSGIGYGALKCLSDDPETRARMRDIPLPEFLVNYTPQISADLMPSTASGETLHMPIRMASESPGQTEDRVDRNLHVKSYVAIGVVNGNYTISWSFRDNVYNTATIEAVTGLWLEELTDIVTFHMNT